MACDATDPARALAPCRNGAIEKRYIHREAHMVAPIMRGTAQPEGATLRSSAKAGVELG